LLYNSIATKERGERKEKKQLGALQRRIKTVSSSMEN
jgi:hypothetical protein